MKIRNRVIHALSVVLALTTLLATTAHARPLENLVERSNKFNQRTMNVDGSATMRAEMLFRHTRYYTDYRQVCDTVQCGHDEIRTCTEGREVCNGREGRARVCHREQVCRTEYRPRYCEVNCRMEPFTASTVDVIASPVIATFRTTDNSPVNTKKITNFFLNSKTNNKFVERVQNPELRKDDEKFLLESLRPTNKTLIVLNSADYTLTSDQLFMRLNPDFRTGDVIELDVLLDANSSKQKFSVEGTDIDLPELHTSGWNYRQD